MLRDARTDDVAALRALLVAAWAATYRDLIGDDALAAMTREALRPETLAAALGDPSRLTLVALDGAALLGVVAAELRPAATHVARLYAAPGAGGRGVGTALLTALRARRPDAPVTLHVASANATARGFYAARGFCDRGPAREIVAGVAFDVRVLELPAGAPMAPSSTAPRNAAR